MSKDNTIRLDRGSGGVKSRELIEEIIAPALANPYLNSLDDAALINTPNRTAFTTDCYVVTPRFFPGGDIGSLSIHGTANDLAMMGARPLYITLGLIIEEGLLIDELKEILQSVALAADKSDLLVVAGDTKVVPKGAADGIYICTAGVGAMEIVPPPAPDKIEIGDKVIVSGTLGDHGLAVMRAREGLEFEADITSDSASLWPLVEKLKSLSDQLHFMRDPTRGGLIAVLNELVTNKPFGVELFDDKIPFTPGTSALAEILGLDPLYIANEGKLVAVVAADKAELAVDELHRHPLGKNAAIIGDILEKPTGKVIMKTIAGGTRILDLPTGELLPRIC
jgi:hydrogenase expression/formation protein HypE